jgi:hypothetical protein
MTQGHLFKPSIKRQFEMFHAANPLIYDALLKYSRQAKAAGKQHYSISIVFERVRWHMHIETTDYSDDFKLNNNYKAYYARLLMEREPDLEGFFQLRRLKAA